MEYIFLPVMEMDKTVFCDEYKDWISNWLYELNENIENECISSSECIQGMICERALGENSIDWLDVERAYLRDENNMPMAYSEKYGKRLYKFDSQWKQTTVYSIYNSFMISKQFGMDISMHERLVRELIQGNGWIYNPEVSNTQIRTRMRSELMMSMAMGTSILKENGMSDKEKNIFEAVLASISLSGYVSAEYFRAIALENIERKYQFPEGIKGMLERCEAGEGYNDFSIADKVDDYMGTKKRTQHDRAIHTPLISCMAYYLGKENDDTKKDLDIRMKKYAKTLSNKPMDIPAFRMRDIEYPFGTGITPLEVLSSASIVSKFG